MVTDDQVRAALEARFALRAERERALARTLESRLPTAARALRTRGASRVWLFGSLAEDRFREDSDVDLAVEGLAEQEHLRAWADCADALEWAVDLVRIEDAPATLVERIHSVGREL